MYVSIIAARTPFYIQNIFISYYWGTQNLTFPGTTNAETTSQCSYSCCLLSKQELGGRIHILVARDAKAENVDLAPELKRSVHFLAKYSVR